MKLNRYILILMACALVLTSGCSKPVGQRELEKGLHELNRGNFVRARVLLEKSISLRPGHIDNAMAHNYLGITAWRLGQLDDAKTAFEDSRRLNPNLIEPIYNLGVLAGEREDMRSAARYLNEAATLNQDDTAPLEYLAELYAKSGQWSLARNALYSALDRKPQSARILNSIASVYAAMGQDDEAIESLIYALETDTKYAPALFNLAVLYDTRKGDADQARAYYKRYISASRRDGRVTEAKDALSRIREEGAIAAPDQETVIAGVPEQDEMVPVQEPAVTVVEEETAAPAVSPFDQKIAEAKSRAQAGRIQQAIDLCEEAAELAGRQRRYDLQEQAYREAVAMAIDQPRAHTLLGQNLYDRGKVSQAARAFRQAITLNENYAPAQLGMARVSAGAGEMDAAIVHYKQAVSSDPSLADAQWELALIYDQQLELSENAAALYRMFAKNFPGDPRRKTGLARAEELAPAPRPDPAAARREAGALPADRVTEKRIEYTPPEVRNKEAAVRAFNRASVFQEQREWDRATYYYLKSLENDDQLPSVFYNLGICYTMTDEKELARDAYVRALKLKPDMVDAQYNLALLYNEAGNERTAAKLLTDLVKRQPSYASAHYALGVLYASAPGTYDLAKKHYADYLKLVPNDPSASVIRSWIQSH